MSADEGLALTDELREAMKSEKFRVGLTFVMNLGNPDEPSGHAVQCYVGARKIGPWILPHEPTPLGLAHVFQWLMQVRTTEPGEPVHTDDARQAAWTEAAEAVSEWFESGGRARGVDPPRNPYDTIETEPDPGPPEAESSPEGWGVPTPTATKFHYFRDQRSLCGSYGSFGVELQPDSGEPHKHDCAACTRKLRR